MERTDFDIIIIGAGPAGVIAALQLANSGLEIAILDKEAFPRDKICGDALSADVVNQLHKIDITLFENFIQFEDKIASNGVQFFAPNASKLDIAFKKPTKTKAPGYISKRIDFDNFLFQQLKNISNISIFQNEKVVALKENKEHVSVKTENNTFVAKILIGADGANSIVSRQLANTKIDKHHHCAGLRQYFENVHYMHPQGFIELHFYKDLLPGYFWIFPLPNNRANVGLGMLSSEVSKNNVNLKEVLANIIETHPNIKYRFAQSIPLETPKGFGLPLGSKKRVLSGDRFLLLGDAAGLIDPFTGEGIANAIRSGRIAAAHILKCFEKNTFNATFNKKYDIEIYQKMWNEFRVSRSLQMLLSYPRLFNFIVKKANRNASLRTLLTAMLDDVNLKKELLKPSFYFKLFFN